MTPHWERADYPPPTAGPYMMRAVLTPHRSLSRKAFVAVLVGFALVDASITTVFLLRGAYPVAFFLILDVLALWFAFRINYRDGQAEERVEVAPERLLVSQKSPEGKDSHWMVSPLWAQVRADARSVRIASAGRAVRVGAFLSPSERGAFARALEAALARARVYRPSTSLIE
jgi:uncharacterized membrane protein